MLNVSGLVDSLGCHGECTTPAYRARPTRILLMVVFSSLGSLFGTYFGSPSALANADHSYCLLCHGGANAGNQPIGGPNLTILPAWYLEEQLLAFELGYRGHQDKDHYGQSMAAAARMLEDDAARRAATAFIATYPHQRSRPALEGSEIAGDVQRGAVLYQQCASCHGDAGAGNAALHAPPLAGQADWYLARQLLAYRAGYRGVHQDDSWGQGMRAMALQLSNEQAVYDVVAYVGELSKQQSEVSTATIRVTTDTPVVLSATTSETTLVSQQPLASESKEQQSEDDPTMKANSVISKVKTAIPAIALATASTQVLAHEATRYPLPNNSSFPIAQAVSVPAGTELMFHSGLLPSPADPGADPTSREFFGDTYTQTMSVLQKFKESLREKGLGLGNIIKMNVFLVGDPEMENKMDFGGFMRAYSQFFGTEEQPHLPARAAVQVAGLARGALIEIEVIAAR
ncbi:MAG: c-type cytochrome [Pseudomonadota bacterium]